MKERWCITTPIYTTPSLTQFAKLNLLTIMDDGTLKLLIGLVGAAVGALAAAVANMYAANRKIKEIELSYNYKLQDGYLENARKFTGEVYVPINILLTQLSNAYNGFRSRV